MPGVWGLTADGLVVAPPPSYYFTAAIGFRSPPVEFRLFNNSKSCPSIGWPKIGMRFTHRGRRFKVKAMENSGEGQNTIVPLQFESPTGQLLSQIMQTHPHLLPAAIDEQLERLRSDRDAQKKESPPAAEDLLLYKRIAEVKEKDRQKALEEIIYCLVVQKFIENNITMIPSLSPPSSLSGPVDSWPNQEQKLESVHSPDALEMIQSHLSLVIGERFVGPISSIVQISKLKLGKLYAASIMYGYFLKRVDQRFQLEQSVNTFPMRIKNPKVVDDLTPNPFWDMESMVQISPDGDVDDIEGGDVKDYRLRSYVMHLEADTLQRYATIRSKEVISLIEKQTQALFGRPDIRIAEDGSLDTSNDEVVNIRLSGLTLLVLEAVAFGSFLWEAESYVESKYHFVSS